MTRSQIAQKYNSYDIADEICKNKLADEQTKATQTKEHPDSTSEALVAVHAADVVQSVNKYC